MQAMIDPMKIAEHWNPYSESIDGRRLLPSKWGCVVTQEDVRAALLEGRLRSGPIDIDSSGDAHAERVAWLVIHEATDPIEIDVGIPSIGYMPPEMVPDGNHRLAAAIYAGRPIAVEITGDVNFATEIFGVMCEMDLDDEPADRQTP